MKYSLLLAALTLFFATGCQSDGLTEADEDAMFQTHHDFAFAYYAMGPEGYDRCQSQIYKAFEFKPNHVELRVLLGQVLVRKGTLEDIASAELVYESLLRDDDPRATLGLATCKERMGIFYDEAGRAIADGTRFTEARDPMARAKELTKRAQELWEEGEEYYLEALSEKSDDRSVLNGLQRITALQGRTEDSLAYANRLLEVCTGELEFWQAQMQRPDLSARDEDSIRVDLRELEKLAKRTHFHAADLEVELGNDMAALDHLGAVARLDPNMPEVHSRRAQLFKRVGDYSAALAEIEEFLRLSQLPFEHPDVNAAYTLKQECEEALAG